MLRQDDDLDDLLNRVGRCSAGLSVDDVAAVVNDVLRKQKRDLLAHMQRMLALERAKNSAPQNEIRFRKLHARLVAVESSIRQILQRD